MNVAFKMNNNFYVVDEFIIDIKIQFKLFEAVMLASVYFANFY